MTQYTQPGKHSPSPSFLCLCHRTPHSFAAPQMPLVTLRSLVASRREKQCSVCPANGLSPQPSWRRWPLCNSCGCCGLRCMQQQGGRGKDWWTGEGQAVGSQRASLLSGKGLNRWTHNRSMLLGLFFFLVVWSFPLGCSPLLREEFTFSHPCWVVPKAWRNTR